MRNKHRVHQSNERCFTTLNIKVAQYRTQCRTVRFGCLRLSGFSRVSLTTVSRHDVMRPGAIGRVLPTTVFSPSSVNDTRAMMMVVLMMMMTTTTTTTVRQDAGRRPSELVVARTRDEWYHRGRASRIFFFRGRFSAGKLSREN